MPKIPYALAALAVFIAGAYVWKVKHAGLSQIIQPDHAASARPAEVFAPGAVVVEVGKETVTQADVDWEYALLMSELDDRGSLTPIPDLGHRRHEELAPLKKALITTMIERKLLFAFIQQDRAFTFDDAARYEACLAAWQKKVEGASPLVQAPGAKDRLKARLCERSLLDQYMAERLFPGAATDLAESEIVEYYKNHRSEFKLPERVEIRHVLFAEEGEARKWRGQITAQNFETIARSRSIAPEGKDGGRLGPFAQGTMPTVLDVAFRMKRGEISDVLRSNYGYHVIMLTERHPAKELGLVEARPAIVSLLKKRKEETAYNAWVERALAGIPVGTPKMTW